MPGPYVAPADHPSNLLGDYVTKARSRAPRALADTALRTGSFAARHILAYQATGGSLADLVNATASRSTAQFETLEQDPVALGELARVLTLQNLLPSDPTDGLALFDLALDRFGPDRIPQHHQTLHIQLAFTHGDRSRAAELCDTYRDLPAMVRATVRLDLANPFLHPAGTDEASWLAALQELFPAPGPVLDPLAGDRPFDWLTAPVDRRVDGGELITVIVTAFKPDARLLTAVRSLACQSWSNLEILIVDDASSPDHDRTLAQCRELDERVRLIKLDRNGGTYVARNVGLDAAAGTLVTFQDSDDWSHPARLEHQAQPLLDEPELVATTSNGLQVTDQLVVTRPGRPLVSLNSSSLMVRKRPVLDRIGYFDSVRRSADTEYHLRIAAAFGAAAVRRVGGGSHALIRQSTGSLSRTEIGAGWIHPARAAYRSSYGLFHQQIREGTASPYLPRHQRRRAITAPAHLHASGPSGESGARPAYDVIFASDWRPYGGPQKSMLAEIAALTTRGMRVGVLQLEAFRFMTHERKPLCRPVQELINNGTVDHILFTDEVDTSLLIIRYPPVLQFPPSRPSNVRPRQLIILANQAPSELDDSDHRYVPRTCTEVAAQLFGTEPVWCPQGPTIRDILSAELPAGAITPFDMPGIIDLARWRVHRTGFRSVTPVIGRHSRDNLMKWPADRETLLLAYPDSPDFDVRIMGGTRVPRAVLGTGKLPPNWLSFDYDEVSVRSLLFQLDFYVYFPHPNGVEAFGRAILEALAVGCVVILPKEFSSTFGDAAVYCAPDEVQSLVLSYYADRERFLAQSRTATERVHQHFGYEAYGRLVRSLIAARDGGGGFEEWAEAGRARQHAIPG